MGGVDEFNDRQTQIEAENEPYNPYEYKIENNESWAGALPVKQSVNSKSQHTLSGMC
jgi:glutamate synthase (NADPH/NADH)